MEPIFIRCDVEIDDVSVLERSSIWNTVTNDLINGSTAAPGEVVIVTWRWVGPLRNDIVMHDPIDFLCSDPGGHNCMASVKGLSSYTTHPSQLLQVIIISHWHLLVCECLEVLIRRTGRRVVWLLDVVRDFTKASEGVWEGTQRTSECSCWLGRLAYSRFLMAHLVELPETCEALLSTEEYGWQAKLNARWTLHGGRIRTVRCCACLLGRPLRLSWSLAFVLLIGICLNH